MAQISIGGLTLGKNPLIKSVQTGSVVIPVTNASTTINSVDVNNSLLLYEGFNSTIDYAIYAPNYLFAKINLANATTVVGSRINGSYDNTTNFQVIEFYPGVLKSNQTGSIVVGNSVSGTTVINSVNANKTILSDLGHTSDCGTSGTAYQMFFRLELESSTKVTTRRNTAYADNSVQNFQVIEFY